MSMSAGVRVALRAQEDEPDEEVDGEEELAWRKKVSGRKGGLLMSIAKRSELTASHAGCVPVGVEGEGDITS